MPLALKPYVYGGMTHTLATSGPATWTAVAELVLPAVPVTLAGLHAGMSLTNEDLVGHTRLTWKAFIAPMFRR